MTCAAARARRIAKTGRKYVNDAELAAASWCAHFISTLAPGAGASAQAHKQQAAYAAHAAHAAHEGPGIPGSWRPWVPELARRTGRCAGSQGRLPGSQGACRAGGGTSRACASLKLAALALRPQARSPQEAALGALERWGLRAVGSAAGLGRRADWPSALGSVPGPRSGAHGHTAVGWAAGQCQQNQATLMSHAAMRPCGREGSRHAASARSERERQRTRPAYASNVFLDPSLQPATSQQPAGQ